MCFIACVSNIKTNEKNFVRNVNDFIYDLSIRLETHILINIDSNVIGSDTKRQNPNERKPIFIIFRKRLLLGIVREPRETCAAVSLRIKTNSVFVCSNADHYHWRIFYELLMRRLNSIPLAWLNWPKVNKSTLRKIEKKLTNNRVNKENSQLIFMCKIIWWKKNKILKKEQKKRYPK